MYTDESPKAAARLACARAKSARELWRARTEAHALAASAHAP
jgi:hypothetical protein